MVAFVLKDLELGNKPYEQNMPESINDMMKDWTKFLPQDMVRFIISLYDLVPRRGTSMVSVVRQVGGLPSVSTILADRESCRDKPRRAKCFP